MESTPLEEGPRPPTDATAVQPPGPEPAPGVGAALELADAVSRYRRRGRSPERWRTLVDAAAVMAIAFGAVGIFVLGMFVHSRMSDGGGDKGVPAAQAQAATTPQPSVAGRVDVSADDDPALGPEDARVTVIEFADYQCPYCGRFHAQTLPLIRQEYGDRIRFVYRDFPLSAVHADAEKAAEAGECAHEQDKFWAYHHVLYLNQTALDRASLSRYAQNVGLDIAGFDSCLDSGKYAGEVANDLQAGAAAGVRGTPAFFVNGQPISGAQPYSIFKAAIDAALAAAN